MRKTAAFAGILVGLTACASVPPAIPSQAPADVATTASALSSTGLTPVDYLNAGFLRNLWDCNDYLLAEAKLSGNFGVAQQATGLATTMSAGLLGLAGAGGPAVGLASVAGGGIASALGIAASNTGIPYSAATAQKVQEAMINFMEGSWASPPPSVALAAILIEQQRWLCTPPGITWIAGQAIATAQIGLASTAPSVNYRAIVPRFTVPVVTINGR